MEFVRWLFRIIFKVFVRTKVYGAEQVPAQGPVVVVSNHESMLDMFLIGYRVPRYIKWMAKEELFKNKLFGKLLMALGAYPVKRGSRDVGAARTTKELLEKGEIIGIFPQGTRSKGRGKKLPAKPGFVRFAIDGEAMIQPVAIWGKIRLFGKVYVRFGQPFSVKERLDADHLNDRAAIQQLAAETLDDIYDMMEVPGGVSQG